MWTSLEEARSDLLLSAGVFVLGGLIVGVVLDYVPLLRVPYLGPALLLVLPLALTVLVPLLLIRYRKESLGDYGVGGPGFASSFVAGALLALPMVAAGIALFALTGSRGVLPVLLAADQPLGLAIHVARWLGLAGLAVYATVKARDAFSSVGRGVGEALWEIGRIVLAVLGVTTLLLLIRAARVPGGSLLGIVLTPLGVAATVGIMIQSLRGPGATTTRATLITPTVIAALGAFALSLSPAALVQLAWFGAMGAAIGLVIGALQESRRSAGAALGVALAVALLTPVELLRI